jgi:hypothetical protein
MAVPAITSAAITELAPVGTATAGCPGFSATDCRIVLARQTGFQAKVGTTTAFSTAKASGSVVAWTISLVGVPAAKIKTVSTMYGGAPEAALVVLAPLGKSNFKVVEKGPLVDLTNYLGTTPTFALPNALPIKAGQVVGITVPTWAPVLQIGLGGDTSWRSSKPLKETVASDYTTQRALVGTVVQGSFAALYQRARLVYSATVVPTPVATKPAATTTKTTPTKTTK